MELNFGYENKDDGIDEIIEDLSGSAFLALREVRWGDAEQYHLDLRRYYIDKNKNVVPGKGIKFSTEEGPTTLVKALIKNGCCDNVEVASTIMQCDQPSLIQGIIRNIPNEEILDEFRFKYESAWTNRTIDEEPVESAKDMLDRMFEGEQKEE